MSTSNAQQFTYYAHCKVENIRSVHLKYPIDLSIFMIYEKYLAIKIELA
jgi:hypothetical protein